MARTPRAIPTFATTGRVDGVEIFTNLPDFRAQLAVLKFEMRSKVAYTADAAAAREFKKAVVARAPSLKKPDRRKKNPRIAGTLKRAIYLFRTRNPAAGTVSYSISWRKGKAQQHAKGGSRDAFYGRFLELGFLPRGPGRRLRGGNRTRALQRQRALDAGAVKVAYPFLVPGFNSARAAAVDAFNRSMERALRKLDKAKG